LYDHSAAFTSLFGSAFGAALIGDTGFTNNSWNLTARSRIFGADFLVLVECKHHKNRIKREHVQVLHGKLVTLGAQKTMLFSTSEFSGRRRGGCDSTIGLLWSSLLQVKLRILPEVRTIRHCLIQCPLTLDGSLPSTTGRVEA
jgi:hypothetical protein